MKYPALAVSAFMVGVGLFGLLGPIAWADAIRAMLTPAGLYVLAATRIVVGAVLHLSAASSRMPTLLHVLGAVAIFSGVVTPLIGFERGVDILDWWATQSPGFLRLCALIFAGVGGFVAYAVFAGEEEREARV